MKKQLPFLIVIFLIASTASFAQNSVPVISNITALADTILHKLTVTYDLSDTENDSMEIFLAASVDGGVYFPFNTSNAIGDIGFPIMQGNGKRIVWQYPDSLSQLVSSFVIKLAANDRAGIDIPQIIDQIDSNRLKQNLQMIAGIRHRTTGAVHLQQVRDSLVARFQQYGLQSRIHSFQYNINYTGKNIVGRKSGNVFDTRTFIVSGHYDTVNDSPGADDNGSAVAAFLEVLRIIAPLELASCVEFIGFDLEESGLAGSAAYVPDGIQSNEDIAGVINMDMIGYYSDVPNSQTIPAGFNIAFPDLYAQVVADSFRGNFIISTANNNSHSMLALFDSMAAQYVPDLLVGSIEVPGNGELISDSRRSDHVAFWDAGYKALHISDGAETRNPNYHSPGDSLGTVNYTFMRNVTMAAAATLLSLSPPLHADIQTAQVTTDPASVLAEMSNEKCKILISPDFTNRHLELSVQNCSEEMMTIKVFSMDGKEIFHTVAATEKEAQIELENIIQTGYYLVEITTSKQSFSQKVFVK